MEYNSFEIWVMIKQKDILCYLTICIIQRFCDLYDVLQGASTGELIVSQLGRIANRQMADAFFERITLFPMEGDPIPNEDCLSNIDTNQFPSIEQFGVICGFLGDVKLQLDDEGGADLARLLFEMKKSCEYKMKRSLKAFAI